MQAEAWNQQEVLQEMLAALHAAQTTPKAGPLPRRQRIYLKDDRPEINGRPMDVNRSDAREWIREDLAQAAPFNANAKGAPVLPAEYRKPEDPTMVPLVFNPNSGRYEPMPAASLAAPASAPPPAMPDLEALVAAEVARRLGELQATAGEPGDEPEISELEALRAAWSEANPGKPYPPNAKAGWFRKNLKE